MSIEDFNNLVISREGSKIVRFKDIGVAEVDAENTRSIAKRNGLPMVMCALIPQPGAKYIDIADRAYLLMQDLEKDLPEDIDATIALTTRYLSGVQSTRWRTRFSRLSFWLF